MDKTKSVDINIGQNIDGQDKISGYQDKISGGQNIDGQDKISGYQDRAEY